ADISGAIADGAKGKTLQAACYALPTVEPRGEVHARVEMDVVAVGPVGRIMLASHTAHEAHYALAPADVGPPLSAPTLLVEVLLSHLVQPNELASTLPALATVEVADATSVIPLLDGRPLPVLPPLLRADFPLGGTTALIYDIALIHRDSKSD